MAKKAKKAKSQRLDADNPDRKFALTILTNLREKKKFSFHKPDEENWNFKIVYDALNEKRPGFVKNYGSAKLRQLFKTYIDDWVAEKGEEGSRPDFDSGAAQVSGEDTYSPTLDSDEEDNESDDSIVLSEQSFAADQYESDDSNNSTAQIMSSKKSTTKLLKSPPAASKPKASKSREFLISGEDMTYVFPYGEGFRNKVLVLKVLRTADADVELIGNGRFLSIKEKFPPSLLGPYLLNNDKVKTSCKFLKEGDNDALEAGLCKEIKNLTMGDPSNEVFDEKIFKLPFECKPLEDSSCIDRDNGMDIVTTTSKKGSSTNFLLVFLRDKSVPYANKKKKKPRNILIPEADSSDSDDSNDSDYDPDDDADASFDEILSIFNGDRDLAIDAVNDINGGGEAAREAKKRIKYVKWLKESMERKEAAVQGDQVMQDPDL